MKREREVWVAGYPSFHGGADTELDNQIDLWRANDVAVNLVPIGGHDPKMKALCDARGCKTWIYTPDIFKDRIVVSYCNGGFLDALPTIMERGKPKLVCWANCMTWSFPKEVLAQANGWIDYHIFQTQYQKRWLTDPPAEAKHRKLSGTINALEGYVAYMNPDNKSSGIEFKYREPHCFYACGRVSRDDANKYAPDTWRIFDQVVAPMPTKAFILGYGQAAHQRCGNAPPTLDWQTWPANAIPIRQFYDLVHTLVHKTGGSRENLPRVMIESWLAGTSLCVEDDYGFKEHIEDGVTGFLCKSSAEMAYRASQLAFDPDLRKKMVFAGHEYLKATFCDAAKAWEPWKKIL